MASQRADRAIVLHRYEDKDKRALVLFLFGLMLILLDFWSVGHNTEEGQYGFHPQSSPHLLWFDDPSRNYNDYIPLSPNGIRNPEIAARYALFIFEPLAINRASQQELTLLPGVGVQLAKNIQHHIAVHGTLKNAADLSQIHGIGPQKARKLLPLITFLQDD